AALLHTKAPLPEAMVKEIAIQICAGLVAAHEQNILHRDLKPNNILITHLSDGHIRAVITDFGLAQQPAELCSSTASSELRGAPAYIAPELWRGQSASTASDIYSTGVILYELLTGETPFPRNTPIVERLDRIPELPSHRRAGVPHRYNHLVLRCLEPDPA